MHQTSPSVNGGGRGEVAGKIRTLDCLKGEKAHTHGNKRLVGHDVRRGIRT